MLTAAHYWLVIALSVGLIFVVDMAIYVGIKFYKNNKEDILRKLMKQDIKDTLKM